MAETPLPFRSTRTNSSKPAMRSSTPAPSSSRRRTVLKLSRVLARVILLAGTQPDSADALAGIVERGLRMFGG